MVDQPYKTNYGTTILAMPVFVIDPATVAGGSLPVGQAVSFAVDGADTLAAIAYVASATAILMIATVT